MILYLDSIITFGKHNGKRLSDIPKDYIEWLRNNTDHKVKMCKKPVVKDVKKENPKLTFFDFVKLEDNYRRTCARIGRRLIYNNVLIPF